MGRREQAIVGWKRTGTADLLVCTVDGISRSHLTKRAALVLFLIISFLLAPGFASASVFHPANIPSSRVHVNTDGTVELHTRFDILAFCLETTPQEIADGPMNALLDGPVAELQNRLNDAKNRFQSGLAVIADNGAGTFDSITFPSAQDVINCAQENGAQRLPVMLTVVVKEHLQAGAKTLSCRFPDILGSVVVTTEMPYEEPVSEPVDPGTASTPLAIPSVQQVSQAAASIQSPPQSATTTKQTPVKSEILVKDSSPVTVGSAKPDETDEPIVTRPTNDEFIDLTLSAALNAEKPPAKPRVAAVRVEAVTPAQFPQTPSPPPIPAGRPAWYILFGRYVKMGYKHILPQGLDHILFVLGLFLLSRKTKPLLTQISCFTIAHSITLGLSLYGVFSLPSSIVEPLIAASIVFVAVENLFTTEMKAWRPFIVFGFGLVHGLGFAGALKGAGLAHGDFLTGLVGFNSGVELGQLSVVALAFLAVGWWRSKPSYRMAVVLPASCAIALVAIFWTIQRTLG